MLLAEVGRDEYLLTVRHARASFDLTDADDSRRFIFARVEEGRFHERGEWLFERVWNGDQTDYGLDSRRFRSC